MNWSWIAWRSTRRCFRAPGALWFVIAFITTMMSFWWLLVWVPLWVIVRVVKIRQAARIERDRYTNPYSHLS